MKQKLNQLAKLLSIKLEQIKKPSPEINVIKNNRNNFGYPIMFNEEKTKANKPK
jgi:hypothetical protein